MSDVLNNRLAYFPASFFGMIMGITGTSIAYKATEPFWQTGALMGQGLLYLVTALFAILSIAYFLKIVRFPKEVLVELKHPIKMNFVPAISISMLLLSIGYENIGQHQLSFWLWSIGATAQLALTLWVLYNWVHHDFFVPEHSNPAWFIPIVGNIVVPIAGVHHAVIDISWFFFSIGLIFWLTLQAILLNRIIFHAPLVERLVPTLFILIAPPAVGFISYVGLNGGEVNQFAKVLYFFALFLTLLMAVSFSKFRKLNFALSWWAYTFPLAAMSIASFLMAKKSGFVIYQGIGIAVLSVLSLMVLWFGFKTLQAAKAKKICTNDH
ncbi:MAG: SLAC1 anion channel family protein [Thiotrichales bacterium]|nr:SLAC1 anion channel family protein [Thiotrichales bacterium]